MPAENSFETDVLVIGGGRTDLFTDVKARDEGFGVTLVDKGYVSRSCETCVVDGCVNRPRKSGQATSIEI